MLKIDVVSYQGKPLASPITTVFNHAGGAIGRQPDCYLALPDPMRHLSRQHARINWRDSRYLIENTTGNNFVIVNGHTLHSKEFCSLQQGHQIYIGHYLLEVAALDAAVATPAETNTPEVASPLRIEPTGQEKNFFDAILAPATDANPHPAQSPLSAAQPAISAGNADHASSDPFTFLDAKSALLDPGDPLLHPADLNLAQIEPERRADDYADPFDLASLGRRNAADPLLDGAAQVSLRDMLGQSKNIDDLYGDSVSSLPGMDPLAEFEPAAVHIPFDTRKSLDPLALFAADSGAVQSFLELPSKTVMDDHADQLVMHLDLPRPMIAPPMPPSAPEPQPELETAESANAALAIASMPIEEAPPAAPVIVAAVPSVSPAPQPMQGRRAADAVPMTPDEHQALIQAFLKSAGLPKEMMPQRLTPEFMETIGTMLSTAMQGTVDLIAARAATKREVKAEMTLILPVHNNPLKFVPDGQAALIHMFGKQIPGFLSPIDAMRDAYQDLRAHQVGVFAGMRAALAEVLQRFSPDDVEQRLEQLSMIDSLMPGHRKAKLWDLYGQQFKKIYAEAEEDFDVIFGDAFAVAYEEQTRSMRADLASNAS